MRTRHAIVTLLAAITLVACGEDRTDPTGTTASDFSLIDANPASATHNALRSLHGRSSEVVLLYFVAFG